MDSAKTFEEFRPTADQETVKVLMHGLDFTEDKSYRVLDFGCGTGSMTHKWFTPLMEKLNLNIIGIDISEDMIRFAKKHHSNPGIEYICENILSKLENNSVEMESLEYIFSLYVLHWLPNLREAFSKFNKLLKSGGEFRFIMTTDTIVDEMLAWIANHTYWKHLARDNMRPFPVWKSLGQTPINYITPIVLASKFEIISLEEKTVINSYSPISSLTKFYLSFLPKQNYENLSDIEKPKLFEDITQFLVAHLNVTVKSDEDIIMEKTKVLIGILRKPNANVE